MNKLSVLLICLLITGYVYAQTCGKSEASDQIQTGAYTVVKQNPGHPRLHTYNIQINSFGVTNAGFEVAVTTSSINGYKPSNGFDYKVSGGKQAGGNGLILSLFINEDDSWTSIRLSYLVSAQLDIIVGSFIGDPYDSSNSAGFPNNANIIENYVPLHRFKNNINYQIKAFISGFRTDSSNFNIYLLQQAIDKNEGRIVVQFQSNANPSIQLLQISYVIYPQQHDDYTFSGSSGLYQLQGPQNFQRNNLSNGKFIMCKKTAVVIRCPIGQILNNGVCLCNQGFILVQNVCQRLCATNAYINTQRQCVCIPGYQYSARRFCTLIPKCGENQRSVQAQCTCVQGFVKDNTGKCVRNCSNNFQVFDGKNCVCNDKSYKDQRGVCSQIPQCPQNQQWSASALTCDCMSGFKKSIFNQCISQTDCRSNEQLVNNVCVCGKGFSNENFFKICIKLPNCPVNQIYNFPTQKCECEESFIKLGEACVSRCPINSEWINGQCVCKEGHATIINACRPCPAGSSPNSQKNTCVCSNQNQIFKVVSINSFGCKQCGQFSKPNSDRTDCDCQSGYEKKQNSNECVSIAKCPSNSSPNQSGVCICRQGLYLDNNVCKIQPTCPAKSTWNQEKLQCQCINPNQYLIDGACKQCGTNQVWNTEKCICRSGFFNIKGICRTCDSRTTYNGEDCICNINFYGNRDKCQPCHSTCSKCFGSQASQCTQCVDISYTLTNGFCTQETPCNIGSFLNSQGSCENCLENCRTCTSVEECTQCVTGFELKVQQFFGQSFYLCNPICGDGRKNDIQQCDDNNTANGDGCNSQCKQQSGWSCSGGSTIRKSTCNNFVPTRSIISLGGSVNRAQYVYQSVKLSYIPTCFTDLQCVDCYLIIEASIIQGPVPTQVVVQFVPNSKGQFLLEFRFPGINTFPFTVVVKINDNLPQQYKNCFSAEDYDQRVTKTIDPATLALVNQDTTLSLDLNDLILDPTDLGPGQSDPNAIADSQDILSAIFKVQKQV